MGDWSQRYHRIAGWHGAEPGTAAWWSTDIDDPDWDAYLRTSEHGQFQQSAAWAGYKARDGWRTHRVVLTRQERIVGGFQLLWRPARLGRIGYVSKGPVVEPESATSLADVNRLLKDIAVSLRLAAVVVQQPDETRLPLDLVAGSTFLRSNPMRVVEATYLVDTRRPPEDIRAGMSPSLRRNLRHAHRRGAVVREGTTADLPRFFELMASTCRRLGSTPNPDSVESLRLLWDRFAGDRSIRLTLAECGGAVPAAKLSLAFGQVLSVWKKGWDGTCLAHHPNEILEEEALIWAHARGLRAVDFCSFDPQAAALPPDRLATVADTLNSRDRYHLRFGGRPRVISPSLVLLPHPVLRWLYANTFARYFRFRIRSGPSAARRS